MDLRPKDLWLTGSIIQFLVSTLSQFNATGSRQHRGFAHRTASHNTRQTKTIAPMKPKLSKGAVVRLSHTQITSIREAASAACRGHLPWIELEISRRVPAHHQATTQCQSVSSLQRQATRKRQSVSGSHHEASTARESVTGPDRSLVQLLKFMEAVAEGPIDSRIDDPSDPAGRHRLRIPHDTLMYQNNKMET